jgi:hypothetical protein
LGGLATLYSFWKKTFCTSMKPTSPSCTSQGRYMESSVSQRGELLDVQTLVGMRHEVPRSKPMVVQQRESWCLFMFTLHDWIDWIDWILFCCKHHLHKRRRSSVATRSLIVVPDIDVHQEKCHDFVFVGSSFLVFLVLYLL